MEVRNLAAMALINIFEKNNLSIDELLKGTGLTSQYLKQTNKFHRWDQFLKMYNNCSKIFGPEYTAREIGNSGINNKEISKMIKIATGFFNVKSIYWAMSVFGGKHLFSNSVIFNYQKINAQKIQMTVSIDDGLETCPLLLESYRYIFENIPNILGLEKAKVQFEIYERKAIYFVSFKYTSFFKLLYNHLKNFIQGYNSTLTIMGEIENQSTELSKIVEEKSQLIRILTHDIANQVMIVDYYTSKVNKSENLTEEERKALSIVLKSTNSLRSILHNVQNMEVQNLKGLDLKPENPVLVFESVFENFQSSLLNKNLKLKLENNLPSHVMLLTDKTSLEVNVLGNLVSNAIKFSPINGEIIIKMNQIEDKVLISVVDNGPGMSDEFKESIFKDKIRKSSLGTNGEKGTGFGLGIVKNYLRLMNGDISIHSNYPSGTVFTIELLAHSPKIIGNKINNDQLQFEFKH